MKPVSLHFLLAACLAWLLSPVLQAQENAINIGTFNVRYKNREDVVHSWDNRKARVKALIQRHSFDIFGAQEPVSEQVNDLLELKEYAHIGVGREDGKTAGEFSPIFYRKDRFEPLTSGTFWLSETPEVPSKGWDALLNRVCSWAQFKDRQSGKTFYFFNVHFDHRGNQAREQSAELLRKKIPAMAGTQPAFLTGDFNATPNTKIIQTIRGFLKDSRDLSKTPSTGPDQTVHGFEVGTEKTAKIDYIFVTEGIEVLTHGTLNDSEEGKYPSDHSPVMIKAVIKP
jgi:endonuclease/exonuclease/phosphatase family metal-dependent hydrolase